MTKTRLETKFFEVRDTGTLMPCMAIKMSSYGLNEKEKALLRRGGYGENTILVIFIELPACQFDQYEWGMNERTKIISHHFIEENFDKLESGSVVDVRFILGETDKPAESEFKK